MIKDRPVHSVSEFIESVEKYHDKWKEGTSFPWRLWFCGEPSRTSSTRLRPKLYRSELRRRLVRYEEQELRAEFRRHAVRLIVGPQPNGELAHWEWYFLMQHYGVPTRLLDWTDGSLVALYFAISSRRESDGKDEAAVYVLDPYWLNEIAFDDLRTGKSARPTGIALPDWSETWPEISAYLPRDPFDSARLKPEMPLAITPNHLSTRFAVQKSQFTIYGRDQGDRLLKLGKDKESHIRIVPIAEKSIIPIRAELRRCGISESIVYPDLDGLGRELSAEWKIRCVYDE